MRKTRPDEERPYEVSKNVNTAVSVAGLLMGLTVLGVILSASPVMKTFEDNVIYEAEMILGAIFIIVVGLGIWNRFVKRTGFKE